MFNVDAACLDGSLCERGLYAQARTEVLRSCAEQTLRICELGAPNQSEAAVRGVPAASRASDCLPAIMEEIMKKRQKEADDAYEAMWDGGRGSHHPDYDPDAVGDGVVKASRPTEELYNMIVKNDVRKVYQKIDEGADVNFVFGRAYQCPGAARCMCPPESEPKSRST